ncbi:2-oxoglutarate oxidoreductase subunit KorA [Bremerella volcania]|uniref:2-oxoglutarate oxidoreductase subunit KorA n=1 Tax=Bremerella volcania TaxID=2527984 RepID=A0A518CBR0_9BACT|nr:2-oxoacid:acceptor oxidoreductase subunit alpha [Bremerella volcania]QDU76669.1 2-oxoglutarate oxidoreductase subunit KorA [Bremerella volcania]
MSTTTDETTVVKEIQPLEEATVRFCGDSGDGMQLAGTQFSNTSALAGNDIATFPDFPAEIRAPRGTLAGVSGFQIHFASHDIFTPGETVDALVAMNPAALKTNLGDLKKNGVLILNSNAFDKKALGQAGYESNPIEDDSLSGYQVFSVPMTSMTRGAVDGLDLSVKEADRCRNFFAMGLVFWLYGRSMEPTLRFIEAKFSKLPAIAEANRRALKAGYNFGETTDAFRSSYSVEKAKLPPGKYRNMTGNQALAWGLISAAQLSDKKLFLGSYPITPASDILHELSKYKNYNVLTFQAEDEIAAVCAAIGAAYGGEMALTTTSGPGMALKGEAMGLAMMLELPLVIVDVQRGGPSTGLPTKTEQADLLQAMFGRNGESPLPIIAARSPADCFDVAIEAWRIATRFMTPIVILTDGYIANGSEPWRIPNMADLPKIEVTHPGPRSEDDPPFLAYQRNEELARPWAIPGTPGLMHRVGGLEKQDGTGNVSYDPQNHHHMVLTRAKKVANIAEAVPPQEVMGAESGKVLVVSWGGTYGSCRTAVARLQAQGQSVSHAHLRYLNPFPRNLGQLLGSFDKVLVPELNLGQLRMLLRDKYLVDAVGLNKVQGKPFTTTEIAEKIESMLM